MERNHPGLNSGTKETAAYKNGVKRIAAAIKRLPSPEQCNLYLDEYLLLVKDHHVSIGPTLPKIRRYNSRSSVSMDSLYASAAYKATVRRAVDTSALIANAIRQKQTGVEGLYRDGSGNLVAFIKEPNETWSYKGIAVRSGNPFHPVGTIRFEIQQRPTGRLWAMVLFADHQRLYTNVEVFPSGIPAIGLKRVTDLANPVAQQEPFAFSMVNDHTAYLRLSSFDASLYQKLKAFYASIDTQLQKTPFLILDLRGNGGGSEENYAPLRKFIFSGPVQYGKLEVWVSPDNINRYEEGVASQKERPDLYSKEGIAAAEQKIALMKAAKPFTFLPLGDDYTETPDTILAYPKKIVLLMDKGSRSAAEGLIAFARQSRKVITMGENSGGYVGFGDVQKIKTPCFGYTLGNTSLRFSSMYPFEFVGIAPQIQLTANQDWLKAALQELNR